jgi:Mrp family chromosome partitioning ATPase
MMASKNDYTSDFFEIPKETEQASEVSFSDYSSSEGNYKVVTSESSKSRKKRTARNVAASEVHEEPTTIKSRSAVRKARAEAEEEESASIEEDAQPQTHQPRSENTSLGLVKTRPPQNITVPVPLPRQKRPHQPSGSRLTPDFNDSSLTERFHVMFQQLGFTPSLAQPLVLGVTSSVRGEGRTTVALGLATAISMQIPQPVLLVEADIIQPTLASDLQLENQGLCEFLRDELPLEEAVHTEALNELSILFAGDANGQALKTLRSGKLNLLFDELVEQYAVVVVDLPPLAMTAEASRLISQLDHVLMVVQASSTPSRLVKAALDLVPEDKRTGVVLNQIRPPFGPFHWLAKLFHKVV